MSVHYANGFISAVTQGGRSYGKTAYNIKNAAYVEYKVNGLNEEDAYKKALDCIIFTPEELLNKVGHNIEKDEISLVWILDDAAVHFSSYLFFINVYQTALLNATFDTIRTVARSLLINCPSKKRLMYGLRIYDDFDVIIYKEATQYERKAVAIKWYSLPDGHRKYRKEFEDYFSCYLPKWVYDEYMIRRKKYLSEISGDLKKLKEKLEKRKANDMMSKGIINDELGVELNEGEN